MIIVFHDNSSDVGYIVKALSKLDDGTWTYNKVVIADRVTHLLEGNVVVVEYANDDLYGTDMYEPLPSIGEDTYIIECVGDDDEYYITTEDSPDTYAYGVDEALGYMEDEVERFSTYDRIELRNVL